VQQQGDIFGKHLAPAVRLDAFGSAPARLSARAFPASENPDLGKLMVVATLAQPGFKSPQVH
jgi:hypothetical protein